jgi:SAM-dependent methyltransferase
MIDARAFLASLVNGCTLTEIDDDIIDLAPRVVAHYDAMGWLYDAVCGTSLYNRIVWGTDPQDSRNFATRIFKSRPTGPHVELGCGALLFSAHLYDEPHDRPCILIDQSVAMLRMARDRLRARVGRVPTHVALVRADGRELPFIRGFASTVLSMHVLHVVHERAVFLQSLASLALPATSTIGLTSLVRTGSHRDALLSMLHAAGELSPPISEAQLSELVRRELPCAPTIDVVGNMAFVSGSSGP